MLKICTYTLLISLGIGLVGCEIDEIPSFNDDSELYFHNFYIDEAFPGTNEADSTLVSFFFYPDGTQDATAPLIVHLSGRLPEKPIQFALRVVPEETTAAENEYTLDPYYVFDPTLAEDAVDIQDTILVKLHRSDRLDNLPNGVRLAVELVPNEFVGVGQTERIRAKIILTTVASQPDWWTTEVTNNLLGTYSQKKFKLFLNEVDKHAEVNEKFIQERPDLVKKMVLQFKTWLYEQNPRIREDNGDLMDVAL